MKNLFKKLLACCLAICMVVTLCVSALTVSAAGETGSVTVADTTVTIGEEIVVPVTITGDATAGLAAADVHLDVDGLSITKLDLECTDEKVYITFASAADPDGKPEVLEADNAETTEVDESVSTVAPNVVDNEFIFLVHTNGGVATNASVVLNITFAALEAEATKTVAVTAETEACYSGDADKDLLALTNEDGTITVEAEAAEEECAHEWKVSEATAAVYGGALGTLNMVCDNCGEKVNTSSVSYKATISLLYNSASFEEQILVNFKGVSDWLAEECDTFIVAFEKDVYGKEPVYSAATFDDGVASTQINVGNTKYPSTSWSLPIAAKEMNDEITATVFMEIDGVWYSGNASTTSFVGYATQLLTSEYDTKPELQKFVANAMYYGGKAQINFNYDVENPAYIHIPAAYEAYVNTEVPECTGSTEGGAYTTGDKTFLRASSMSAESKTEMNHKFLLMDNTADISKVTIKATFTKDDDSISETTLVYNDVATQEQIDNSEVFVYSEQDSGFAKYTLVYAGLAAKEMRKVVTFETFYDGVACASSYSCSLENLAAMTIAAYPNDQELIDMLHAMLNYGDAAADYFS